jgi:hypothetical protein
MINVSSNFASVLGQFTSELRSIASGENKDKMLRTMATLVAGNIRYRVHQQGIKTDGTPIGAYKNPYLAVRQRKPYNRTDSTVMIFSLTRQMENDLFLKPEDNPLDIPIKTASGYGIGFKNSFNKEKADWLQYGRAAHTVGEHTRKAKDGKRTNVRSHSKKGTRGFGEVYMPSQQEIQQMRDVAEDFINNLTKKKNA